jgi:carbon monoxide dehydrogenase subunit G
VDTLTREITIGRPREEVAEQLQRFEDHPRIFTAADEVQLVGEDRYRYEVSVGPVSRAVDTHVTRSSDDLITWRAEGDGYREAGEARLIGDGPGRTLLRLSVAYELNDVLVRAADRLGLLERGVDRNLEQLRTHLEERRHLEDEDA